MAAFIKLPTYLTLSTLSREAAEAINAVHATLGLSQVIYEAGGQNPYILTLNDLDMGGAPFVRGRGGELAVCGPIENTSFLTLEYVGLIRAFGGDVEGLPVWFVVEDLDAATPVGLVRSKNEAGEQITWREWASPNHPVEEIDGRFYVAAVQDATGVAMLASQWPAGVEMVTADGLVAARPDPELPE